MPHSSDPPSDSKRLRLRAEAKLGESEAELPSERDFEPMRLLHELEVHRIELEMQNAELVASRQEIEEGLRRYTEIFDFAPIGHLVVAAEGNIRQLNLAAARLLDAERKRLVGRRLGLFVSEPERAAFDAFLGRVFRGEEQQSASCELALTSGDAPPREVRLTGARLAGEPPTALLSMADVTERKHAESRLRDEGRHKDEFLAALSHELRNPLAPIRSALEVLDRAEAGSELARKARATLERQVDHLVSIVDDLLDVTRVARGKVRLRRAPLELGGLVRGALDDLRLTFESRQIAIVAHLGSEACWVDVDATRLRQVVGNLLANAAGFTGAGGRVEVSLRQEREQAVLRVRDTGIGIAPDLLARLFEPFQQAPQPSDRERGGLGLGLALVKGLVELHGGTVDVASEGVGRGAEFTVRLPLAPAPRPVEATAERLPAPRWRMLIIEDNEDAADCLRAALELAGHEVQVAHDGPEGLALAKASRPEVVLCDIGLPGMDGYEVARALRGDAALEGVLLIALSGYALPEDRRRAREAGFDRHVAKPPTIEALEQVLAEARREGSDE